MVVRFIFQLTKSVSLVAAFLMVEWSRWAFLCRSVLVCLSRRLWTSLIDSSSRFLRMLGKTWTTPGTCRWNGQWAKFGVLLLLGKSLNWRKLFLTMQWQQFWLWNWGTHPQPQCYGQRDGLYCQAICQTSQLLVLFIDAGLVTLGLGNSHKLYPLFLKAGNMCKLDETGVILVCPTLN